MAALVANFQPSPHKSIYDAMDYPKRQSAFKMHAEAGISSCAKEGEHLQAGLTLALERLHKSNGNSLPVLMLPPDTSLHDMDVYGMDLFTLITVPECKKKWWRKNSSHLFLRLACACFLTLLSKPCHVSRTLPQP